MTSIQVEGSLVGYNEFDSPDATDGQAVGNARVLVTVSTCAISEGVWQSSVTGQCGEKRVTFTADYRSRKDAAQGHTTLVASLWKWEFFSTTIRSLMNQGLLNRPEESPGWSVWKQAAAAQGK